MAEGVCKNCGGTKKVSDFADDITPGHCGYIVYDFETYKRIGWTREVPCPVCTDSKYWLNNPRRPEAKGND